MPISSNGYIPNAESTDWRLKQKDRDPGNRKRAGDHAERKVFDLLPKADVYLIVQDAFPCHECHTHFEGASANYSIILKVTSNNGNYSADHGLGLQASVPRVIYYYKGASKMVGMSSRGAGAEPPAGFPAHPDFTDY